MVPLRKLCSAALLLCGAIKSAHSFSNASTRLPLQSKHQPILPRSVTSANLHARSRVIYSSNKSTTSLPAVEGDFDPDAINRSVNEVQSGSFKAKLRALYKFTRPHTIRGTILASIAGTIRALVDTPGAIANAQWGTMLPRAVIGMIALLLGNAFIVGINQIFDRDIDVLNKPFLPVASGEMSGRVAWITVLFSGIVGPAIV